MQQIEAIFHQGVFKPLQPVDLSEDQRVQLHIEPTMQETPLQWLERVRTRREAIAEREGMFSDVTSEIALDRQR